MSRNHLLAGMVLLLLVAPSVEAHITGSRPILQPRQLTRIVDLIPEDPGITLNLQIENDPLRHLVVHRIDPSNARFSLEYREDASIAADRLVATWRFARLIEYRDLNFNGLYESTSDTPVKSWSFDHFDWRRVALQSVLLGDVQGMSGVWEGNLTAAPSMRMEVAFAGKDFIDEGAVVRPQDVILYFDVARIPTRSVGGLYALELDLTVQPETTLSLHRVNETGTALLADSDLRRAFFVWGGEGFLDGREQRLAASLEDERIDDLGNKTARLVIHLPTVDQSMRFVMVSGVEYGIEPARSPTPMPWWVAAIALALLAARRPRLRDPAH